MPPNPPITAGARSETFSPSQRKPIGPNRQIVVTPIHAAATSSTHPDMRAHHSRSASLTLPQAAAAYGLSLALATATNSVRASRYKHSKIGRPSTTYQPGVEYSGASQ